MIALLASVVIAAAGWAPLVQPEPVLVVEASGGDLPDLTEVVGHGGGFAALHRSATRWDLLTSPDGRTWAATPVEGAFAATGSPVALTAAGADLVAFEATPALVMWRSADGSRWERTDLGSPWPAVPGLRLVTGGVSVREVGGMLHVHAGINALADWEALLGVPDHLVMPTVRNGETLHVRVTSGDREGTYEVRLTPEESAVLLQLIDAGGGVAGQQRLAPIADPDEFVTLFIACGGFAPMTESWWFGPGGEPAEPPGWTAELGDYPVVAAGPHATLRLDEHRRLFRLDGAGGWERAIAPTSLLAAVLATGDRMLLVGEEPATGLTVWELVGDQWQQLPTPAVDGHWLAAAVPTRGGAVLVYDTDGPPVVTAVVAAHDGRARTYRLDIPDDVWGLTVQGDTAVVRTVRSNGDTALWAWRIERPEPQRIAAI